MNEAITLFKHNPSAYEPELLEKITVQREELIAGLLDAVLDLHRPRHQLLVGPRGMGKTHLLSLVDSRVRARSGPDELVVAWLEEDAWTIRTYEKLLAEIASLVGDQVEDPSLRSTANSLRTGSVTGAEGEKVLRKALGDRRLLLMVENLDRVFRKIGEEGQARLRNLAENWGQMMVLGTAPQVFGAIVEEDAPFHDFFEVTELEELTVESAMELMRRITRLNGDQKLLRYLGEERAKKRFAAIEALAGGHPRIWLLFAGCISVEAIDELVPLFLKALDELTPYYQARLDELGDQQQELVVLLSEAGGALSNRALAERSGIAQNQVASMLRQLTDKGYVRPARVPDELAAGDSRMSFWELREPLMRLCLDVKKARGEPLRMVIEFLRAWYGTSILDELVRLPAEAELAATYASEAFRTLEEEIDFEVLLRGSPSEIVTKAEIGLSLRPEMSGLQIAKTTILLMNGEFAEARDELERLLDSTPPGPFESWLNLQLAVTRQGLGEEADITDQIEAIQGEEWTAPMAAPMALTAGTLMRLERFEDALRVYRQAAVLEPDQGQYQADVGGALVRLGRPGEALAPLHKAVELAPENALCHFRLGLALGGLGRHKEALASFTKATELDPSVAVFHSNRGVALRNLGRLDEALEATQSALELNPEDAVLHGRYGRLLDSLGQLEEALNAHDLAVELDPERSSLHGNRGALLGKMGRLEEALEAFERAAELDPSRAALHANRGLTLDQLGHREEALSAFDMAIDLEPENAQLQGRRALILGALGRSEEAMQAFDRALALKPNEASIWNNQAVVLGNLDRFEEALKSFTKAVELDPSQLTYVRNRARTLEDLGRHEEALQVLLKAIERDPSAGNLHRNLGVLLEKLGRSQEAVAALEKARELDPEDPVVHNGLANALRMLGRFEEAKQAVRQAIEIEPAEPVFRFTLVEVLLSSGDFDAAVEVLQDALQVWVQGPDHVAAGEPDLLCQILWEFRSDAALAGTLASLVEAYTEAGAGDELVRGIVSSVPLFVDEEVEDAEAEAWVEAWASVPAAAEIEIPVKLLQAALAWKRDRDRAHLLELPHEQREILVELLNK